MGINHLLVIDEISMFEKSLLCKLSDSAMVTHSQMGLPNADRPFEGMNMIISGDFHQFPPVANAHATLYDLANSSDLATQSHALYRQFKTVVLLKDQILDLTYPPALIKFRPMNDTDVPTFEGLSLGVLPIIPSEASFPMKPKSGSVYTVHRHQLALTAAYSFTHHKGQGQTLGYVKVDLADPPRHPIDAFHAYVALS
ncbi:uncharacterized protein ARMOST_08606 [Armillaria ostoyae]|uniref:ATP-dependent DNA helicase n=1 Tax=Armillaria ostoyae TaxID=47428 RepID=A0A284R958_ARMOS|nr:uncharacterized protein ARMOST_08606 [Armillaria ostoyae]